VTTFFYAWDHLGTIRLVSNPDRSVLERHDYEPFGVELRPILNQAQNTHQFTGHERDQGSEYDYMHFRYYGSNMGRFMRPDSFNGNLLDPQSWNKYSYVNNNPVRFNDPTGHAPASPWSNDPEQLKKQLDQSHAQGAIPGNPFADAEHSGGGGGRGGPSGDVNLRMPVYFDAAMGMTKKERASEFNRINIDLLGEAFAEFGAMGIMLDVYNAGTVDLDISGGAVTVTTEKNWGFAPGSLIIVRTNNGQLFSVSGRASWAPVNGSSHAVFIRAGATSWEIFHEFAHAFGYGRKHILDHPSIGIDVELRMIKYYNYGEADARSDAASYANAY
jgi:RHS repeat-associated protein